MFEVIMLTLQMIADNVDRSWNIESSTKANNLFAACTRFPFIISLVVGKQLMYLLMPLTKALQGRDMDIKRAHDDVKHVLNYLVMARENVDIIHDRCFQHATELAAFVEVEPRHPRICKRQTHRQNHPTQNPKEYYKVSITVEFLDFLVAEVKSRFNDQAQVVVKGFTVIPSNVVNQPGVNGWQPSFLEFCAHYKDDLPSSKDVLQVELFMWESFWCNKDDGELPNTIAATLKASVSKKESFPNIFAALKILGTIPVTSCECERCVSVLRRLKTYLRSTMLQERLNGLAMMSIHRNRKIDVDQVINLFAAKHPRKMILVDLLDSDE